MSKVIEDEIYDILFRAGDFFDTDGKPMTMKQISAALQDFELPDEEPEYE